MQDLNLRPLALQSDILPPTNPPPQKNSSYKYTPVLTEVVFQSSCSDSGARMTDGHETAPASSTRFVHLDHVFAGSEHARQRLTRDEVEREGG